MNGLNDENFVSIIPDLSARESVRENCVKEQNALKVAFK